MLGYLTFVEGVACFYQNRNQTESLVENGKFRREEKITR
jgi:hypothetical protein